VPVYPYTLTNLFVVELPTMTLRRLTPTVAHGGNACASDDGRWAIFDTGPGDQGKPWSIAL
jgi:hypothetical protein